MIEEEIKTQNVLFIDDDSITNYVHEYLITEQINYKGNYHFCINGLEAIEYLKELAINNEVESNFPDIIFLDINMPELNGFGFIEEFKKFPLNLVENTKIYILTSSLNESDKVKASKYKEVNGYLLKPIDATILKCIIETQTTL
jgi:CheY-like chemotaxis protein